MEHNDKYIGTGQLVKLFLFLITWGEREDLKCVTIQIIWGKERLFSVQQYIVHSKREVFNGATIQSTQ